MGARQLTLAGDVAGLGRGARLVPGVVPRPSEPGMVISCPAGGVLGTGLGGSWGGVWLFRLVFAAVRRPPWG